MNYERKSTKKMLILSNFDNVDKKLNEEHRQLINMKRQILGGNRILSNIKTLKNQNNNNIFRSSKNINEINRNNLAKNIETEINSVNRFNIYNYIKINQTEENKDNHYKINISEDKNNGRQIIKCILERLSEENKKKMLQNKLKLTFSFYKH